MPNDDLGQFPTPTDSIPPVLPTPLTPDLTKPSETTLPDLTSENRDQISDPPAPAFEETPDEIPSAMTSAPLIQEAPATTELPPMVSEPEAPPQPIPATSIPTPNGGSAFGYFIAIILLLISGIALAVTVFLYSQSQQLKKQLADVTQTLEQQRTVITPTPTPTIIDFPTPTSEATDSALLTPTPTPTATISARTILPLAEATKALGIAIKHLPNAQMIIIKTENATSPTLATTKYFFRQDLTTKKYFYVLMTTGKNPEIVDKATYVTPDNNIPSLNDSVQGNALGLDLDEAIAMANAVCTSNLCTTAPVKGQYILSGANPIWQLSFTPADSTKGTLIIQINAKTKEIIYKSVGF